MNILQCGIYEKYIFKVKNGDVVKFSYKNELGLYYQKLCNNEWSKKIMISRIAFKGFYAMQDYNNDVYLFYQNIYGNIVVMKFGNGEFKSKETINICSNTIMPINIRAFFCNNDIHLIYNVNDEKNISETLVEIVKLNNREWSRPHVVLRSTPAFSMMFKIVQDCDSNIFLIDSDFDKKHRIIVKYFNARYNNWAYQSIIYESQFPCLDCDLTVDRDEQHYICIIKEHKKSKVVYLYKKDNIKRDTIVFYGKNVSSCLIKFYNNILWIFWISDNELYGSFSFDRGIKFSMPKIYIYGKDNLLETVLYKSYEDNTYISVPYRYYAGIRKVFFFKDFLKKVTLNANSGFIEKNKVITAENFKKLYDSFEYEKEELNNVKYRLKNEIETNKMLEEKYTVLRDEIAYLKNKLKSVTEEKLELEGKINKIGVEGDLNKNTTINNKFIEKSTLKKNKKDSKKWFWKD